MKKFEIPKDAECICDYCKIEDGDKVVYICDSNERLYTQEELNACLDKTRNRERSRYKSMLALIKRKWLITNKDIYQSADRVANFWIAEAHSTLGLKEQI